jgi:hypothetical protein
MYRSAASRTPSGMGIQISRISTPYSGGEGVTEADSRLPPAAAKKSVHKATLAVRRDTVGR